MNLEDCSGLGAIQQACLFHVILVLLLQCGKSSVAYRSSHSINLLGLFILILALLYTVSL